MSKYTQSEWIKHTTDEMPVPGDTLVLVRIEWNCYKETIEKFLDDIELVGMKETYRADYWQDGFTVPPNAHSDWSGELKITEYAILKEI